MSHKAKGEEVQGTGFYGLRDGCLDLKTGIPERFRRLTTESKPIHGTSLAIAGFEEPQNWRRQIATSVVENFFYAIDRGDLTVLIEPGDVKGGVKTYQRGGAKSYH